MALLLAVMSFEQLTLEWPQLLQTLGLLLCLELHLCLVVLVGMQLASHGGPHQLQHCSGALVALYSAGDGGQWGVPECWRGMEDGSRGWAASLVEREARCRKCQGSV